MAQSGLSPTQWKNVKDKNKIKEEEEEEEEDNRDGGQLSREDSVWIEQRRAAIFAFTNSAPIVPWSLWEKNMPKGVKFMPTEQELLLHYLRAKKYRHGFICPGLILYFDLYNFEPYTLPQDIPRHQDGRMYLFTALRRLHRAGTRAKRSTPNGCWKKIGAAIPVKDEDGKLIGTRADLVYYAKNNFVETKTQWLMHEFQLLECPAQNADPELLDECVLCEIYQFRGERQADKKSGGNVDENNPVSSQVGVAGASSASSPKSSSSSSEPSTPLQERNQMETPLSNKRKRMISQPSSDPSSPVDASSPNHEASPMPNVTSSQLNANAATDLALHF